MVKPIAYLLEKSVISFVGSSASARKTGRVPKSLRIIFMLSMALGVKIELIKTFFISLILQQDSKELVEMPGCYKYFEVPSK